MTVRSFHCFIAERATRISLPFCFIRKRICPLVEAFNMKLVSASRKNSERIALDILFTTNAACVTIISTFLHSLDQIASLYACTLLYPLVSNFEHLFQLRNGTFPRNIFFGNEFFQRHLLDDSNYLGQFCFSALCTPTIAASIVATFSSASQIRPQN